MPNPREREPNVAQIRALIQSGKIFELRQKSTKGESLEFNRFLTHRHEIVSALNHPELSQELFARIEGFYQRGESSKIALAFSIGVIELAYGSQLLASRARAAAYLCFIVSLEDVISRIGKQRTDPKVIDTLTGDTLPLIEELGSVPQEQSSPRHCVEFLDTMERSFIAAPGLVENVDVVAEEVEEDMGVRMLRTIRQLSLQLVDTIVRDKMYERNIPKGEQDGYRVEEYRALCLQHAETDTARRSLLNDPSVGELAHLPLWGKILKEGLEKYVPERSVDDYPLAVVDPHHPRHAEARRILRLFLFATTPQESTGFVLHMAAFPSNVTDPKPYDVIDRALHQADAKQRLQRLLSMMSEIYGEDIRKYIVLFQSAIQVAVQEEMGPGERTSFGGIPAEVRPLTVRLPDIESPVGKARPLETLALDIFQPPRGRTYARVVQRHEWTTALPTERIRLPEINTEQKSVAQQFLSGLTYDLEHSTVAFEPTSCVLEPDIRVDVKPKEPPPAMTITATSDECQLTLELDEHLAITTAMEPHLKQRAETLQALGIAALHDTLVSRTVRVPREEGAPTAPSKTPEGIEPTPSSPKPPRRVHRSGPFLIITEKAEAEDQTTVFVQETLEKSEITLTIDIRPHWRDLAPQLTREARRHAVEKLKAEGALTAVEDLIPTIISALTADEAHRLTIGQILRFVFKREKRELPDSLVTQLEETAHAHYNESLQHYVATQGMRMPDLSIVSRPDLPIDSMDPEGRMTRIRARIEEDRKKMEALGLSMVMPERTLPTQTYVPFSRSSRRLPMKGDVARTDQYLVIRGGTAVEAVKRFFHKPA